MGQAPVVQGKPVDPAPGYVPGPMYAAHAPAHAGPSGPGYGGYPHAHGAHGAHAVPMGMLPPEEQIILNYRMAVMCFAMLDLMNTSLNVLTAWALNPKSLAGAVGPFVLSLCLGCMTDIPTDEPHTPHMNGLFLTLTFWQDLTDTQTSGGMLLVSFVWRGKPLENPDETNAQVFFLKFH